MIEKIDKIQALLNVPNVDADTETAIANMKILNLLVDLRAEAKQLILSGVSDIVHRAELKVLENVSDYIPCEIYSQAVIFSQKKRDNVR